MCGRFVGFRRLEEWKGDQGHKQPMFLTLPDGSPFAFAGLWEIWDDKGKAETPHRSVTIPTREASESVMPHSRPSRRL